MNQYVKPVNAATGDFWHTFNDLRIPGRGMPLTFTHTYNSLLANQDGPLGFGWTNNENMFLTTSVTGAITVTEEGGSAVSFTAAGNVYQAPTRVLAGLVRNGDGTLTFTRYKERIAYTFASPAVGTPGVLLKETDRNGYTTTFTYSNGHLSSVTDAAGRSLTFTYTGSHIAGITDPIGRTVTFGYDGAGNLTSVVDVGGHVTQFAYGTGTHLMTSMTDPNGGTTSNLYDSNGRAISQTDPLSRTTTFVYTDNGDTTQTTTVTDPRGTVTKEHYQYNELYSMTKASGTPQQATWTYAYDPTTLGITSKTDPNGHTTTMTYDSSGNLLTSIDPLLRTTSYAYDGLNDTTAITDSLGNVTSMTYDSNGNLLSTSRTLAHSPVGAMTAGGPMTLAPRPHMVLAAIARSNGDSIGGSRVPYGRDSRGTRSGQPGASRLFTARPQGTAPYAVSLPGARATGGGWRIAVLHSSADNGHQYEVVGAPLRAGAVPVHAAAAHQRVQVTYAPPSPRRRTPSRCTPAPMIPVGEFIVAPKVVTQGTDGRALHVTVHGIGRYMPSGRHGLPGQARIHLAWDAITVHGRWHMGRDLGLISRQKYGTNTWTATVPHYLLTHADIHRISVFIVFPNGRTTDSESGGRLIVGRRAGRGYLLVQGGHICPPTPRPTPTATPTRAPTVTALPSRSSTSTETSTPTSAVRQPTRTTAPSPIPPSTATPTSTSTQVPPIDTPMPTTTLMPPATVAPSASPTSLPSTSTSTAIPAASTSTATTLPAMATDTPTTSVTATPMAVPSPTATSTLTPRATISPTTAPTATSTASLPTVSATNTGMASPTGTSAMSPIATMTVSNTVGPATITDTSVPATMTDTPRPPTRTDTATPMPTVPPPPSIPCPQADPDTATTCLTYDPAHPGDVIARTDPDGHTARYAYDQYGNLASASDPLGDVTTYTYDLIGRRTSATRPLGNVAGTSPTSYTTAMAYDAFGDTTAITDAQGNVTTYGYDQDQNLITTTDPLGRQTIDGYNLDNERTSVTRPDGAVLQTAYDDAGNVATTTDGLSQSTRFAYDALNRLISTTAPLGRTTVYTYDLAGNKTAVTDPLSQTTAYTYDAANEVVGVLRPDGTSTATGYDLDGRVASQTDGRGSTTSYGYDSLGSMVAMTDGLGRVRAYGYDLAGNRTSLIDPMGRTTASTYDAANRLVGIAYSDGSTPAVQYVYDADGDRTTMRDGTGTTRYIYDTLDRATSIVDGSGQMMGYGYDGASELITLTYPGGKQVARAYDTLGRVTSVSDWLGHTTAFGYDGNGNVVSEAYPNASFAVLSYNAASDLTGITDTVNGTPRWTFGYDRNALGQVSGFTDSLDSATHAYSYDSLRRLTGDSGSAGALGWAYDAADNLTAITTTAGTQAFAYDQADQLTALTTTGAVTTSVAYAYNADGDRTGQSDGASGARMMFGWDQADRLVTATVGTTTTASYMYNGDGLRQSKTATIGGVTTTVETWDIAGGLPHLVQDGSMRYVYGPLGPIEQIDASNTPTYFYQDQLGDTRNLVDGAGSTVGTYSYDAYGKVTKHTGIATPLQYTGQYTDAETGLQYMRARYYDPATGQFLSRDPLVTVTGQAYAYIDGDPLNGYDPFGLCSWNTFDSNSCISQAASGVGHFVVNNSHIIGTSFGAASTVAGVGAAVAVVVPGGQGVAVVLGYVSIAAGAGATIFDSVAAATGHGDAASVTFDVAGLATAGAGKGVAYSIESMDLEGSAQLAARIENYIFGLKGVTFGIPSLFDEYNVLHDSLFSCR